MGGGGTFWRSCCPRRSCSSMASLVESSRTLIPRFNALRAHLLVFLCFRVNRSCNTGHNLDLPEVYNLLQW